MVAKKQDPARLIADSALSGGIDSAFLHYIDSLLPEQADRPLRSFLDDLLPDDDRPGLSSVNVTALLSVDAASLQQLYLSACGLHFRKKRGMYYTPNAVADRLAQSLFESYHTMHGHLPPAVLDPACGAGDLLAACLRRYLEGGLDYHEAVIRLHGFDIDRAAVFLTRLKLLQYHPRDEKESRPAEELKEHICLQNFLDTDSLERVPAGTAVISNPPWSTRRSDRPVFNNSRYTTAAGEFCLSSVFIEHTLQVLPPGSLASFLVPSSLARIKNHLPLRRLLQQQGQIIEAVDMGDPFPEAYAPAMVLSVSNQKAAGKYEAVRADGRMVPADRFFGVDSIFNLNFENSLESFFEQIERCPDRLGSLPATFFLGIVTGNNSGFITKEQLTPAHRSIISGRNVKPFQIDEPEQYILFEPERFQQVCPEEYFYQKKLVYKFISNRLVCAVDDHGRYLLNSANGIFLDKQSPLSLDFLSAWMNSPVINAWYRYRFQAVRVLKGNLQRIPVVFPDAAAAAEFTGLLAPLKNRRTTPAARLAARRRLDGFFYNLLKKQTGRVTPELIERLDQYATSKMAPRRAG